MPPFARRARNEASAMRFRLAWRRCSARRVVKAAAISRRVAVVGLVGESDDISQLEPAALKCCLNDARRPRELPGIVNGPSGGASLHFSVGLVDRMVR